MKTQFENLTSLSKLSDLETYCRWNFVTIRFQIEFMAGSPLIISLLFDPCYAYLYFM